MQLAAVFGGIAAGTVSICGMIPNGWGLIGWTISMVSAVRVLSTNRRAEGRPRSIILRVILASLFVFCFVFLITMSVAIAPNAGPVNRDDKIVAAVVAIFGTVVAVVAMKLN
ncbi:MAG TPA: hypothetical protein VGH74_07250 [Planctomycetaceae bacterium]